MMKEISQINLEDYHLIFNHSNQIIQLLKNYHFPMNSQHLKSKE